MISTIITLLLLQVYEESISKSKDFQQEDNYTERSLQKLTNIAISFAAQLASLNSTLER